MNNSAQGRQSLDGSIAKAALRLVDAAQGRQSLDGFRVSLAMGGRNASLWALRESGASFAEVAAAFGITRARAQQVHGKACGVLSTWPEPNTWQAALPMRLRELCIMSRIRSGPDLSAAVLAGRSIRGWSETDIADAKRIALDDREAEVLCAIAAVQAAVTNMTPALSLCADAGVLGVVAIMEGATAFLNHGRAVYADLIRAERIAANANMRPDATP